ncbi:MAG: PAS domain S-box protein, partial [Armatimonadia bacterium]|nr:PAS domain S-box protein [Armatimonadia bacterium]
MAAGADPLTLRAQFAEILARGEPAEARRDILKAICRELSGRCAMLLDTSPRGSCVETAAASSDDLDALRAACQGALRGAPSEGPIVALPLAEGTWRAALAILPAADDGGLARDVVESLAPSLTTILRDLAQREDERRQHEAFGRALEESEELHRATLESISDAVFVTTRQGRFTFVCPNADVIFGYAQAEVQAMRHIDGILPGLEVDWERLAAEDEIPNLEHEVRDKAGILHSLLINIKRVSIGRGEVLYTCRDVTLRQQMERALRDSEARYRALFDSTAATMLLIDPETGEILDANPAASRFYGYTVNDLRRMHIQDINVLPASDVRERMRSAHIGESQLFRFRHRLASGEVRSVEVLSTPIHLGGREALHSIVHDITERERARAQLMEYQRRLQAMGARIAVVEESERRRIAAGLHDSVAQKLIAAQLKLRVVEASVPGEMEEPIEGISELLASAAREIRTLTFEISPPLLYEMGLEAAVEWLVRSRAEEAGIAGEVIDDEAPKPLSERARSIVFQAVRELVINVVRHAQAAPLQVRMGRVE